MLEVIIADHRDVDRTVNEILLTVPPATLDRITVVGGDSAPSGARHVVGDNLYQAYNAAAATSTSDVLAFVPELTQFKSGWYRSLLADLDDDDRRVTAATVHALDVNLSQFEPNRIDHGGFDLGLNSRRSHAPLVIENGPLAVKADRFRQLGGFDAALTSGHNLEFCLKNWLCGGSVKVSDGEAACVRSARAVDDFSAARIARIWFDGSLDKFGRSISPDLDTGKWEFQQQVKDRHQVHSVRWLIDKYMPALGKVYDLRNRYVGKTVAVLCDGPSLDRVNKWEVYKHGLVIGVDYVPTVFQCDYVASMHRDPVRAALMTGNYQPSQFLLSETLRAPDGVREVPAVDVVPGGTIFGTLDHAVTPSSLEPPVVNVGHSALCAVHLAAFMGASQITLYGWDGKLVGGRSHTSLIAHYGGGRHYPDNKQTRDMYDFANVHMETLARVLSGYNVPVMRYSHL